MSGTVLLSIGLIIVALSLRSSLRPEIFWGLFLTAGLLIPQRLNNMLITLLRAYKEFKIASRQMVYSSIVNAVTITFMAYHFKIYGYIMGLCLSYLFNIIYILLKRNFNLQFRLNWVELKPLVFFGVPLLFISLMNVALMSIDRLMVAGFMGLKALGLYSIALLASSYVVTVPNSMSVVIIPNFQEKFGEKENIQDLKKYMSTSADVYCFLMPFIIATAWIFCVPLISLFLPNFTGAGPAVKYLLLGSFFVALRHPYSTFMIAIKKHWTLIPVVAVACVVALMLNWRVITLGYGIAGVAMSVASVKFGLFSAYFILAARYVYTATEARTEYFKVFRKFVFMLSVLLGMDVILPADGVLYKYLLQYTVFLIVYLPSLYQFNIEYEVMKILKSKLKATLQKGRQGRVADGSS